MLFVAVQLSVPLSRAKGDTVYQSLTVWSRGADPPSCVTG